ncbi:MAG: RNA-guided endonuclease IscB [Candidatus Woesearchaeota archaeon]
MKNTQQKFEKRNTYTPTSASLACSPVAASLNKPEMVSERGLKTFSNNLEENQHQRIGGLNAKVFVLSKDKKPLMPCKPAKARHLIRDNKAEVMSRKPFTIRLLFDCENQTQPIKLGVDAGYSEIGFSATAKTVELISGKLELRKDVSKKIKERAMYRKGRRNKLWYRQARFDNRTKSKKLGWLAPSIRHKLDSHIRLIEKIKKLLPISDLTIEVASFDAQKMMHPEISGIEYQQGELEGYEIREYLLEKFRKTCVYCKKTSTPSQIEHIIPKSRGGSNKVSNLAISCEECNLKKGSLTAEEFGFPNVQAQAKVSFKAAAFMNNVKRSLVEQLGCNFTFGYVTKHGRIKLGLEKSHINDAFVISGGKFQERCKPFALTQTRRNNRCLQLNRKGFKPSIRRARYPLQPNDQVKYKSSTYVVKGMFNLGKWVALSDLISNKINANATNVRLLTYGKGIAFG